jgi:stalled ribosome rescue protein Dom34
MSVKNKKQFGIWMDAHQAIIVCREGVESRDFVILGREKNNGQGSNSNENAANNAERTLQHKFFKEISAHMQNVDEVHVTGTGQVQEQFIKYLAETPQFKNTVSKTSTSNEMSNEKLVEFITKTFN